MLPLLLALTLAVADDAEALDKFKADIKGKDGAGRAAAVEELAKTSSLKVCSKLASLMTNEVVEVKIAAAKGLEVQEDKKHAAIYLLNGAAANAKEFTVLAAILEALGKVKEEIGAPEINKHFSEEDVALAKSAVDAAGDLKSASSFDPLIKELKKCEALLQPPNNNGGGGGRFGGLGRFGGGANGQNPREARMRAQELKTEIMKVLTEMAKVHCQDGADWENWWKEHRGTWKPDKS